MHQRTYHALVNILFFFNLDLILSLASFSGMQANCADIYQTPQNAAYELGLHGLLTEWSIKN